MPDTRRLAESGGTAPWLCQFALHEVQLRGLVETGRLAAAADLLARPPGRTHSVPPQWRAICQVTTGEILLAQSDPGAAEAALTAGIETAESHRLPHQVQRALRAADDRLPRVTEAGVAALGRLREPAAAGPGAVRCGRRPGGWGQTLEV